MKANGDVDSRVPVYIATALGRDRVASPMLYTRYSFYSWLSGPQEKSGYEEVKKTFTPSTPGPSSPSPSVLPLEPHDP